MAFSAKLLKAMMPSSLDGKAYSSTPQTNQWIVVHNTAGGTANSNTNYFHNGAEGRNVSTHYVMDDKEIYQLLEDNWKGQHTNGKGQAYTDNPIDASSCSNSNSIGIEVADGDSVNHLQAIENLIELIRYLMKTYNIDVDHVVRHGDTQGKECPATIMNLGKWPYIKEQLKEKTEGNVPLEDFSNFTTVDMDGYSPGTPNTNQNNSGVNGNYGTTTPILHSAIVTPNSITTGGTDQVTYGDYSSYYGYLSYYYGLLYPLDIVPNVDHRYNIANMDKVTSACLIFLPPYNVCTIEDMESNFQKWGWDRKYHYVIDPKYIVGDNPDDDKPIISEDVKHESELNQNDNGDSEEDPSDIPVEGDDSEDNQIQPRIPVEPDDQTPGEQPDDEETPTDPIETPDNNIQTPQGDNTISISGGFKEMTDRLLQCYGIEDNDKVTYINRALFKGKPTAHTLMIACCIPTHDELTSLGITFDNVEKNIIDSVSKILWANGLGAADLWREFDLNRAASPAIYLDRDDWKDLLAEIDKQVEWRNKAFGKVTAQYEPYVAQIPDQNISYGTTGNGSTPGGGTNPGSGTNPDIGNISDVAEAVWTFFTKKGFTPECTAGIMGNLQQESGMDPTKYQSGGGKGRGICQWSYGEERFEGLKAHAASKGVEWTDLQSQLEWLDMELQGKDSTTLALLKQKVGGYEQFKVMTNVREACRVFEESFERAGTPMMEKRYSYAEQYYEQFKNYSSTNPDDGDPGEDNEDDTNSASVFSLIRTVQARAATFSWPTPGVTKVSSKFGPRTPPCPGASSNHGGIDISAPMNTDVCATAGGTVTLAQYSSSAGNYLVIDHGNGWGSRYLHLNKFLVSKGDTVVANQVIAKSGNTGIGTGAHLHFEIQSNFPAGGTSGTKVDPLLYVSPGEVVGDPQPGSGDSPGTSTPGTTTPGSGGGGGGTIAGNELVNSLFGEIQNPGPAANLPYTGNSMGGLEHDNWGGKMLYYLGDPTDSSAEKPEILEVLSVTEYQQFCDTYFKGERYNQDGTIDIVTNFNQYWELMDLYAGEQEPYDKGLVSAKDATILPNERLSAMTTNFTTDNENSFHFNVLESGPGTMNHCAKAADELNYIIVPKDLKVEPIYPDLIIPPHYSTSGHDTVSENTIPLCMIETLEDSTAFTKQLSFDYDLLNDITKESNKRSGPINFMDPYPTDDKIEELEQHYPKVFVDEIEAQLYSCNHPGCPIAQPMAKNFAMLSDAVMNQSKRVEKRLVRLENILSTIMRNQARLSSRININCVYYGGQSTYAGKYKCIRCMHDDRINDGAIVTLDQCLNCTRYEPILGQVYQILDESGFNGSVILDDMQMSYSDLTTFKKQNIQIERSPRYDFVEVNSDTVGFKPPQTRIEIWKEANKQAYLASKPAETISNLDIEDDGEGTGISQSQYSKTTTENSTITTTINGQTTTDNGDVSATVVSTSGDQIGDSVLEAAEEANYIFRMNWNETFFNSQQPDTKPYPTEGIIMRFKKQTGDLSYTQEIAELDPVLDADAISDLQRAMKIANNEWTETREVAETLQVNKYSSEKFYFKGFAEIKTFDSSQIGQNYGPGGGSNPGSGPGSTVASQARNKIVEMAKLWLQECNAGKAWYCQDPRTVDNTNPKYSNGKKVTDCSGLVSCCYMHAGLKSMYSKSCGGGSLMAEIVNNGGQMWLMTEAGIANALPGDVLVRTKNGRTVTEADMGTNVPIEHAMVYIGDGQVIHASSSKKGIVQNSVSNYSSNTHIFVRPKDLMEADELAKQQQQNGSSGKVDETAGTINGKNYVAKVPGAVCTSYSDTGAGSSGMGCEYNKTCASHNIPYGSKIYIPGVQSITGGDAIFTVTDTGGYRRREWASYL